MSDTSQGPGWWLASDGKWYPPQPQQAAPTESQPQPADTVHTMQPRQSAPVPAGAVGPQGPGWWQATDGLWYPPQGTIIVQEAPKKKFYKRVWFWLLVVVVLGFSGCVAIIAGGSNAIVNADNKVHTVVYSVTGNGTADISYSTFDNGNSGTATSNGTSLPWAKTVTAKGIFSGYDVSVIGDSATSVACTITVDGKQIAHNTGSGQSASADCNGVNP